MSELTTFVLALAILLGIVLAIIISIKNSKFNFMFGDNKKDDALLINVEHHDNDLDKWFDKEFRLLILNLKILVG